jgi:hypothetical protein
MLQAEPGRPPSWRGALSPGALAKGKGGALV